MIFHTTPLAGTYVIEPERHGDDRGYFARTWAAEELAAHGLDVRVAHMNTSYNARAGTLRGMHFQRAPHAEAKLVRATRGAVFDVALDLREDSPTYGRWHGAELSADDGLALFIPAGCAHGFQSLEDASEVLYVMSVGYEPEAAHGVRFDDPAFAIDWPAAPGGRRTLSERDRTWPLLAP